MKILNLIKLEVELNLRRIAYFIGISSIILWFLMFIAIENKYSEVSKNYSEVSKNYMDEYSIGTSYFSIPILTSIFILVVTRKFKEIKQLIKEIE